MSAPWQDEWVRITLRLPRPLHQRLTFLSHSSTSLNAAIVDLLEVASAEPPTETEELQQASISTLHAKLDAILERLA